MGHYGASSEKPQKGWTNNSAFSQLYKGKMARNSIDVNQRVETVRKTIGKSGKPSYSGTPALKKSQPCPHLLNIYYFCLVSSACMSLEINITSITCVPWFLPAGPVMSLSFQLRTYPPAFGEAIKNLMPQIMAGAEGIPDVDPSEGPIQVFEQMAFTTWPEAKLGSPLKYLRGNKHLNLPAEWKQAMPQALEILHHLRHH